MACENFCHSVNRDHKVTVDKSFSPDVRKGKGGHCVYTGRTDCGPDGTASPIDATTPTKTYTSKAELAAEWDATCPAYQNACTSFNQVPAPPEVTMVYYDDAATSISAEVLATIGCVGDCYATTFPDLKDDPRIIDVAILLSSMADKQLNIVTCDPAVLDPNDAAHTSSIGYILKQLGLDVNVNYQDAVPLSGTSEWIDGAVSGVQATQQFDTGSGYDLFYNQLAGISPAQITTSQANTLDDLCINYVECIASGDAQVNVYKQGILQSGVYADSRHKCCALQARLAEVQFADTLANGAPLYDEDCYIAKIDRYSDVLLDWVDRKLITGDRFDNDVDRSRGYRVNFPEYSSLTSNDFAARALPCGFGVSFDSGRIHSTCFDFEVRI